MSTIPIEIIQLNASGEGRYSIVSGIIEGNLSAGIDITADLCHGISLGIEPSIVGSISGQAQALLAGVSAEGQASAEAGIKAKIRVSPNPFETLGVTAEGGLYAFAAAAGRVGVYLTPEYLAEYLQQNADELTSDIFLIFAEEIRAEVGIWGKVAASASIEGRLKAILNLDGDDAGFEISGGFNAGWGAGTGWDFYCEAGFNDLRRAIYRTCLRLNKEVTKTIQGNSSPEANVLASAFDFSFPLTVLIAYDLGVTAKKKGALLKQQDVLGIVTRNFNENLQRYISDSLTDCAAKWLTSEFRKLTLIIVNKALNESEIVLLESRIDDLIRIVSASEFTVDQINLGLSAAIEIIDLIDENQITSVARPLTTFWFSAMLGLRSRQLLDGVSTSVSAGSSLTGSAGAGLSLDILSEPPQLVINEVNATLGENVTQVDIGTAVDYLVEIGAASTLAQYSPEFEDFRLKLESSFGLTAGDIVEDVVRSVAGIGTLSELNSYAALKQFIQQDLLRDSVQGQLLPMAKAAALTNNDDTLHEYIQDVVEPCTALVSEFIFAKMDDIVLGDVNSFDDAAFNALLSNITGGCGTVVYQVLARNFAFFDRVVTEFMLESAHEGFTEMQQTFSVPEHQYFQMSREVLETYLPGNPNLAPHSEALTTLLGEIATAYAEMTGPEIFTPERLQNIYELKRDILLSISGDFEDRSANALEALVDDVIDCLHIPDLDKMQELANLIFQIQSECFDAVRDRMTPALAAFYLAITQAELNNLRSLLDQWINDRREDANDTAAVFAEFAEWFNENILVPLEALANELGDNLAALRAQFLGGWAAIAKGAVRNQAESIITANLPQVGHPAAIATFAATQWLVINPILDAAIGGLQTVLSTFESTVDGIAAGHAGSPASVDDWISNLRSALKSDLQNMVVVPVEETADLILGAVLSPIVKTQLENYVAKLLEQAELALDSQQAEQHLEELRVEMEDASQQLDLHEHKSNFSVTVSNPLSDENRIYSPSIKITVISDGLNDAIMSELGSKRLQFRLNGKSISNESEGWTSLSDQLHVWCWRSPTGDDLVNGLNLFEISWIRGSERTKVDRQVTGFLVDKSALAIGDEFVVSVDADPPGTDVNRENVLLEWNGDKPLDLTHWTIRDRVNHKYKFPSGLVLVAGQTLRIVTGGDPSNDSVDSTAQNKMLYMGRRAAIWNNTGDLLELLDDNGVVVWSHAYGDALAAGVSA